MTITNVTLARYTVNLHTVKSSPQDVSYPALHSHISGVITFSSIAAKKMFQKRDRTAHSVVLKAAYSSEHLLLSEEQMTIFLEARYTQLLPTFNLISKNCECKFNLFTLCQNQIKCQFIHVTILHAFTAQFTKALHYRITCALNKSYAFFL